MGKFPLNRQDGDPLLLSGARETPAGDGSMVIEISLLGGMLVRTDTGPVAIAGQKDRALLGYLASSLGSPRSRSTTAALLWGERGDQQARDSLKQSLWHLRKAFLPTGLLPVVSNRQSVGLDANCVRIDVAEFERSLGEGTPEALDRAIELYRGEFLDGLEVRSAGFEDWMLMERQRLRRLAAEALAAALSKSVADRQRERTAVMAGKLFALDPYHEDACRALMQSHAERNERIQALKLYESFRRRLVRDLSVEPEPATVSLYNMLRMRRPAANGEDGPAVAGEDGEIAAGAEPLLAAAPSIAVLPLINIGDDPEQDYFSRGLTDDIVTELSQLSGLVTVIHPGPPGARSSPQESAAALNVRYILDGSVRRVGDRVRVTTQLIEGATSACIWAQRFDRNLSDIFLLQEGIAKGVAEALRVKLLPDEMEGLTARPTASVEAYQLYLLGRSFYLRGTDKRSMKIARDLFSKSCEIDPLYARAHAARSICESSLCGNDPSVTIEQMFASSDRAIALAPELGEAYAAKGLALYMSGHHGESMTMFDKAIALDPDLFEANFFKARCCRMLGQRNQAVALFEKAAEIRPNDYRCTGLLAEEYRALGLWRDFRLAALRCLQQTTQEVRLHPDNADAWAFGSTILVELDEPQRGEEWAGRAAVIGPDDYLVHYNISRTYALLGKADLALAWLRRALGSFPIFRQRLLAWIPTDQAFEALRDRPGYTGLVGA